MCCRAKGINSEAAKNWNLIYSKDLVNEFELTVVFHAATREKMLLAFCPCETGPSGLQPRKFELHSLALKFLKFTKSVMKIVALNTDSFVPS